MFESRLLRRIFGPKREEVARGWRRLHNEELHNLYTSSDSIRVVRSRVTKWAGYVAYMEEMKNAYKILAGRPEGKGPLKRYRLRWECNIRMDLREIGCKVVD